MCVGGGVCVGVGMGVGVGVGMGVGVGVVHTCSLIVLYFRSFTGNHYTSLYILIILLILQPP